MKWCLILGLSLWALSARAHVPESLDEETSPLVDASSEPAQRTMKMTSEASAVVTSKSSDQEGPKASTLERDRDSGAGPIRGDLGLGLTVGTGLNVCVPRGDASCTDLVPGPLFSAGFEYRFWRMGIGLNYATGRHFPIGTGAQDVSVSTQHFTFDILGYFPTWRAFEPFAALGLGYGQLMSKDDTQQSRVEWSSLWQTAHLRGGVRHRLPESWQLHSGWFWTMYSALYFHQGGERCVFYNAQGACRLTEELSGGNTDFATTLELGGQVGFGF